jgi:lipopolysaccharide transport system ATP-binding protein
MSEVLIKVEGVSKKFCRSLKKSLWYGVQDICADLNPFGKNGDGRSQLGDKVPEGDGSPSSVSAPVVTNSELLTPISPPLQNSSGLRPDEFWAVDDVSFELRRGECLGLIGRNGAGKSTLLKMLNGLIKPDSGSITMRGRVGALIALGAGFNPILSGRENIYVNASVLGLTKRETDQQIDDIIEFADIREFINAPVQSYSSGMRVRLGFAIATALRPDIVLLDEVLAVGDARFRHKCYHRINKLVENAAVILVSHSMDYISQLCSAVLMMRRGKSEYFADPLEGVSAYGKDCASSGIGSNSDRAEAIYPPIRSAKVRLPETPVHFGAPLSVEVEIESEEDIPDLILSFNVINQAEQGVMNWSTLRGGKNISLRRGRQLVRFSITPLLLNPGRYTWDFNALRPGSIEHLIWFMQAGEFEVEADFVSYGEIPYLPVVEDCDVIPIP